jgi:predicted lipoprotein with Yx(FWY)xxD motif
MRIFLSLLTAGAGLALAGCGGGSGDGAEPSDPSPSETRIGAAPARAPAATGTKIAASGSDYGRILFGPKDGAIYLFDRDHGPRSDCYGNCAAAWPPVLTEGEPRAGAGVRAGRLGTTERRDGTTQVTYAGHPLYYYRDDPPGEVLCQDVEEFGGLWLVVGPSGEAVR